MEQCFWPELGRVIIKRPVASCIRVCVQEVMRAATATEQNESINHTYV